MTKEELIAWRESMGLTQEQFARFIRPKKPVVVRTVWNWENGISPVPLWVEDKKEAGETQ